MRIESITNCAEILAREISESRSFDVPSLKTKIELRMLDGLEQFTLELMSGVEQDIIHMKRKMMLISHDKNKYVKMGFELSILNSKLKTLKKQTDLDRIKRFLKEKYPEVHNEFILEVNKDL